MWNIIVVWLSFLDLDMFWFLLCVVSLLIFWNGGRGDIVFEFRLFYDIWGDCLYFGSDLRIGDEFVVYGVIF